MSDQEDLAIQTESLTKIYGRKHIALNCVDLEIEAGTVSYPLVDGLYDYVSITKCEVFGRFLDICHRRGLKAIISTNLSYPERFLQPLKELPVEVLIVSISGFSQEIYARNHVGGKIDWVRKNLLELKGQDNIKTIKDRSDFGEDIDR